MVLHVTLVARDGNRKPYIWSPNSPPLYSPSISEVAAELNSPVNALCQELSYLWRRHKDGHLHRAKSGSRSNSA